MRLTPINEAEAILEPYWDGGSSEHPTDKFSLLSEYSIHIDPSARAAVSQGWCAVEVKIDRAMVGDATPGQPAVVLERTCDLDVSAYDILRLFASLPGWVQVNVWAVLDGERRSIFQRTGADTNAEFDGPFTARHLNGLRLEFSLTQARPASCSLMWLGVSNRLAQDKMEARPSPYTPDWPGALLPESEVAPMPEPAIGIFFDSNGLAGLREKIKASPYAEIFCSLRQQADELLSSTPEADIGYLIPNPDRRWVRDRDMQRKCTAHEMELLAFVGLVDGNPQMGRLAARMALSAAHCDTWCESLMGVFPGATWHHRSFTEEIYCRGCALVLDWAGMYLTPHGRQIIRDAIAMKGLPRIESDFKRMEYIRTMNQGIVFSSGRILGLLGLLPAYPRYCSQVEEAERDLHEMITAYVKPDGGTLEGMAYWCYTFGTVMPLAYALARFHGQSLAEYAPLALVKTGDYALAMRSTLGDGATYLGINDAHNETAIPATLVAAYCLLSEREEWQELYANVIQQEKLTGDIFHLIIAPDPGGGFNQNRQVTSLVQERFDVLPDVGQVSSVRRHPDLGHVLFHLCSGPTDRGHFHADKGSFILEVKGETLACDRGVTTYDHPEVGFIGTAARHNLLYPEHPEGILVSQPAHVKGGLLISALEQQGAIFLACDNTYAWEDGLFAFNERRVFSPSPELYLIDDEVEINRDWALSFRLNSRFPMRQFGEEVWVDGVSRASLRLVPLNWRPVETTIGVEGIDDHLRPINLLRLVAKGSRSQRLLTAIEVVPASGAGERWQFHPGEQPVILKGDLQVRYRLAPGFAEVSIPSRFFAVFRQGGWQVG
jgi:hypothetical protein